MASPTPTPTNRGITIQLSPGLQELVRRGPRAIVGPAVARAMDLENEHTIGAAVQRRMSFPRTLPPQPDGLRVQTTRLRRSLGRSPAHVQGNYVISGIGSQNGPGVDEVRYFGVHEFGWAGTQNVPAHRRKLPDRYRLTGVDRTFRQAEVRRAGLLTKKGKLRSGLGETIPGREIEVRAHTREMKFPARRMVRLTVTERAAHYTAAIAREIQAALGGGSGGGAGVPTT